VLNAQIMAQVLNQHDLLDAVPNSTFSKSGSLGSAGGIKCDFRAGPRILKVNFKSPVAAHLWSGTEKQDVRVAPGEMVFILTEDPLELSQNMVARLSPKRKLSHVEVPAMGGFCTDPLDWGRSRVGLNKFAATSFPFIFGKQEMAAALDELGEDETDGSDPPEASVEYFPEEQIRVMQSYESITIKPVADLVHRLSPEVEALRRGVRSHQGKLKMNP
jgi:hypothetical protein